MSIAERHGSPDSILGVLDLPMLTAAACSPQARIAGDMVRRASGTGPGWLEPGARLASDRLVIHADGGKVIYRVGAYHPDGDWYDAEWPD